MIKAPIAALVMVVALLGGFYGGYKVGGGGQASAAALAANGTTGAAAFGRGLVAACPSPGTAATPAPSGRVARRGTSGTVSNLTASSLTVHDARCGTDVKVTFDASVIVRKTAMGQVSDLQESETVTVVGTRQADGSVKANSIQIIPAGAGGFGGGGFGGANGG